MEEQLQNRVLCNKTETLELELQNQRKKVNECEQQTRAAEAAFFDAAHQLKGALKAASRGEELKRILDNVQKRFLLFGEVSKTSRIFNLFTSSSTGESAALGQFSVSIFFGQVDN